MYHSKKRTAFLGRAQLRKPARTETPAFTLVELIVVITILAVLATVGFLALSGYTKDASKSAVKANLKTLAQAVSSESAVNGNSPRRYVVHSGAVVLSGATFSGIALLPGAYGTPGTNYSAGTADFWALRTDSSKFKNPDGTPFLFAALDWSESLPSGKTRSRSFFQVAGFPESGISGSGTMAVEGTYPVATTLTTEGLIASSSGSNVAAIDGLAPGVSNVAKYPGCDTPDITLANGQVWAACNVGATVAYAGQAYPSNTAPTAGQKAYLGAFYQWGRNDDVTAVGTPTTTLALSWTLAGGVGHSNFIIDGTTLPWDWITTQNDNLWGGGSTSLGSGVFAGQTAGNQATMKGPCASGYHVPTQAEWWSAISTLNVGLANDNSWQNDTVIATALKLPLAGYRDPTSAIYYSNGTRGIYWTSSPSGTFGHDVTFSPTQVGPAGNDHRAFGFSVRCLKN